MFQKIIHTKQGYIVTADSIELYVPNDPSNRHWQLVQDAIAEGVFVTVEQTQPTPIPNLSFAQLLIGLVSEGWITETEGDSWADGILPTAVTNLIGTLPQDQQFAARTRAKKATEILRLDPLVELLGLAQDKTAEEVDEFFIKYANS